MVNDNMNQLLNKIKNVILESNCSYGEVTDALANLKIHFAMKAKSLANVANIHEVNKFPGIRKYDD